MKRRIDKKKYPLKGWVKVQGDWKSFQCNMQKQKMITTDIGQQTAASGFVVRAISDINFKINHEIVIGSGSYTVDSVDSEIDKTHGGQFRGQPRWVVRLDVS